MTAGGSAAHLDFLGYLTLGLASFIHKSQTYRHPKKGVGYTSLGMVQDAVASLMSGASGV